KYMITIFARCGGSQHGHTSHRTLTGIYNLIHQFTAKRLNETIRPCKLINELHTAEIKELEAIQPKLAFEFPEFYPILNSLSKNSEILAQQCCLKNIDLSMEQIATIRDI